MRGQVCWSMGKLLRVIGHLAFTVNLGRSCSIIERVWEVFEPDRVGDVTIL